MTPRWPLSIALALAALATPAIPERARAEAPVRACLPVELEPALRDAIAIELGTEVVPCDAATTDAALRIVIQRSSPVAPLDVEVWDGERHTSARTAQPFDVMGPQAVAVVVHGLIDELRAPPSPGNPAIAESRPPPSAEPEPDAALPDTDVRPVRPRRPILGILAGLGRVIGFGDVARDGTTVALTLAIDGRLHDASGHGGALTARLAPIQDTAGFHVDVRYSFRLGFPPAVDVLTGAMFLEVGLGVLRMLDVTMLRDVGDFAIERIGVGPSFALVGVVHFGPFTLGLDTTVIATVSPWGTRGYYYGGPGPSPTTLAIDLDLGLRVGSHLPL